MKKTVDGGGSKMQGDGPMEEADYEAQCQAEAEAEGQAAEEEARIHKHCLPKQKVREAIEKIDELTKIMGYKLPTHLQGHWVHKEDAKNILIKELGLLKLFGMEIKEDKNLKPNEFRLENKK